MLETLSTQVNDQLQPEQALLNNFEQYKYTEGSGKAYTIVSLTQNAKVYRARIYQGNSPQLNQSQIGQVLNWNIKSYQTQRGIFLSGFWNDRQNAPQNTQNTQQQPTQGTNLGAQEAWLPKIYDVLQGILEAINLLSLSEGQRMAKQFEKEQNLNEEVPDDTDAPF